MPINQGSDVLRRVGSVAPPQRVRLRAGVGDGKRHRGLASLVRLRSERRGVADVLGEHLVIAQALIDARRHLPEPALAVLAHDHVHFAGSF